MNILIVEDDARIARHIAETIAGRGWRTAIAATRASGMEQILAGAFDALIVDRMLPDGEGLELLRSLREQGIFVPALALSALIEADEREDGLELGADDYMCKPYSERELLHRLDGLLTRTGRLPSKSGDRIYVGDIEIDLKSKTISANSHNVAVTPKEFQIVLLLAINAGNPVHRDRIAKEAFSRIYMESNAINVHMNRIRPKFEEVGSKCKIQTIRNIGYALKPGKAS